MSRTIQLSRMLWATVTFFMTQSVLVADDWPMLGRDKTRNGDISSELAVDQNGQVIPHRRLQAVVPEKGEQTAARSDREESDGS